MSDLASSSLTGSLSMDSSGCGAADAAHATAAQATAGQLLRQAREACGLHIAALAVSLKVPVKKLEALEADRLDLLPDAVFVRALASSVCRTLKIDASPILQRLPQTSRPKLTYQGASINAPFHAPSDGPSPTIWTQVSRPAVLAGLVLLLGAVVLIFLPALKTSVNEVNTGAALQPLNNESAGAATILLAEADSTDVQRLPKTDSGIPPSAAPVSPVPLLAVSAASPAQAPASAALPPADIVVFSARSESWVEVTDSRGQVVLRRILGAGETVGASGALPLAAVVGRADATQVQVRGKAFDLSAFARDNVARFEVK